jgi:hypothetical protein
MDQPVGHSPIGMSVFERRANCPGSMRMEAGRVDPGSSYARRGTELHAVAAACLTESLEAEDTIPDDPDGADLVRDYLDVVRAKHGELGGRLLVEQAFRLSLHELFWGTCDVAIVAPPRLWLADLKTGIGHHVAIRRDDGRLNWQLGGYALGALESLPAADASQITEVELCVIQPRTGPPRSTVASVGELHDLAADMLDVVAAAHQPDAPLLPGEHCAFCRARSDCPALRDRALAIAEAEFDVVDDGVVATSGPPPPESLTPLQLGQVKTAAAVIGIWLEGVNARARALADEGVEIPGWKLVDKRGRRIWADEVAAERTLGGLAGPSMFITKFVSPAVAEKVLKRFKLSKPANWNALITKSDPGTDLVPAFDPRPAVPPRITTQTVEPEET